MERKDGLSEMRCLAPLETRGAQGIQQHPELAAGNAFCSVGL